MTAGLFGSRTASDEAASAVDGNGCSNVLFGLARFVLLYCSWCSFRDRCGDMKLPAIALTTALFVIVPQAACAATLDGEALSWPFALPFGGLLLSIALGPLLFPGFWHHHYGKIAIAWSAVALGATGWLAGGAAVLAAFVHAMLA